MAEKEEQYKVYLLYEESSHGGEICAGQEEDAWPSYEDQYHEFTPKGLRLEAPAWSETIEVDFDPKKLDHLYVVIVRYSSGDTFGTTLGNWHIIGAYKSFKKAEKIRISIDKNKYKGYKPWEGYFESLEGVTVERLDVWK